VLILLSEPTIFVNFLLQHKVGKAGETLARVTVNATLGLGGLIDVAKRPAFNLPYRPNGFADTMGFYGVRSGPYLFLPLIGSTTTRDLAGRIMDLALLPAAIGGPFKSPYYGPVEGTIDAIDYRVEVDADLRRLRDESPDAYVSMRQSYLEMRQAEIDGLHGKKHAAPAPVAAPTSAPPEAAPAPAPTPAPSSAPVTAPPAQAAPAPVPWLEAEPVATYAWEARTFA
jgi:phospholipid-binding lipoprotein MlaA